MQVFYADNFVLPLPPGHRFPMPKYKLLRDRLGNEFPLVRLAQAPAGLDLCPRRLHCPALGGAPHRNSDGEEIPALHLHMYREGYGDKWAIPVPADRFTSTTDPWETLEEFMRFCNITQPPRIERGLFT